MTISRTSPAAHRASAEMWSFERTSTKPPTAENGGGVGGGTYCSGDPLTLLIFTVVRMTCQGGRCVWPCRGSDTYEPGTIQGVWPCWDGKIDSNRSKYASRFSLVGQPAETLHDAEERRGGLRPLSGN